MNNTFFENEYAWYQFDNGILIIAFKKIKGTLQAAKTIVTDRLKFSEGKSYPVLADVRAVKESSKEALDYFGNEEAARGIIAGALLTESFISRFLANTFLRLTPIKKKFPTKVFNSKQEALHWLKQYVNE